MDEHQREADGQAGEVVGGTISLRSGAKHDENEEHGKHNLDDKAVEHAIATGVSTRVGGDDGAGLGC